MTFTEVITLLTWLYVLHAVTVFGVALRLAVQSKANDRSLQFWLHLAENREADSKDGPFVLTVAARLTL